MGDFEVSEVDFRVDVGWGGKFLVFRCGLQLPTMLPECSMGRGCLGGEVEGGGR